MASTNKTTNYNLSQYVGSDKPTYLGDYNGDMQKIDARMKTNADGFAGAQSLAQTAKDTADLAETHAQTALTNAGTAQNTATNALTKATANETDLTKFNLYDNTEYTSEILVTNGTATSKRINVITNSDGSMAKIYGNIAINGVIDNNSPVKFTIPNTKLRPDENISIRGNALLLLYNLQGSLVGTGMPTVNIDTQGNIEVSTNPASTVNLYSYVLFNSLLYIKDFGDAPSPQ